MPDYRLYLLNEQSGRIDGVEEFHSPDDAEAIRLSTRPGRDVATELWRGRHKVARFAGPGQAAPSPDPDQRL